MMIADDDDGQFPEVNETHPKLGTLSEPQHKSYIIIGYVCVSPLFWLSPNVSPLFWLSPLGLPLPSKMCL